jgi:hypothetical protein
LRHTAILFFAASLAICLMPLDGFGRSYLRTSYTGPAGWIYQYTSYTERGKVAAVSTPYYYDAANPAANLYLFAHKFCSSSALRSAW